MEVHPARAARGLQEEWVRLAALEVVQLEQVPVLVLQVMREVWLV